MITFKALDLPEEWAWAKRALNLIICEDSQGIVARDTDTGEIQAVCVADSFGADSCNVHIAVKNPFVIRRGFLHEVSRHLFLACGMKRLFGLVPENNAKALKFDKHIGFTEVARVPHGCGTDTDYVVMCMERAECRWLPEAQREAA